MRYVLAKLVEYDHDKAYRIYVTRSLQLIPQSQYLQASYTDTISGKIKPQDTRDGDEIASDVMTNAGLKFGDVNDGI